MDGSKFYDWWGSHNRLYYTLDLMTKPLRKQAMEEFDETNELVLDLGCEPGRSMKLIDKQIEGQVIGVDYSKEMTKSAYKNETDNSSVIRGDARKLPLPSNSVDGILMSLSLSAMPDINATISELARVTKQDATIMVVDTTVPGKETTLKNT